MNVKSYFFCQHIVALYTYIIKVSLLLEFSSVYEYLELFFPVKIWPQYVNYLIAPCENVKNIGPLNPAIHGIRVASVIEFSVCVGSLCVCLLANSLEYPERIQRGLEWTQFLKRVLVCSLSVSKFTLFLYYKVL